MLVNKNTVVNCLFMLVHSAFTNVHFFFFRNALVNAEININYDNKCCRNMKFVDVVN